MAFSDRKFTLFPQLPVELRLMVFEFALPSPQVVHLDPLATSPTDQRSEYQPFDTHEGVATYEDRNAPFPHPGILRVNRESRALALRHYTVIMNERHENWCSDCSTWDEIDERLLRGKREMFVDYGPEHYVDYKRDVFIFDESTPQRLLGMEAAKCAQNVFIQLRDRCFKDLYRSWNPDRGLEALDSESCGNFIKLFPSARRLYADKCGLGYNGAQGTNSFMDDWVEIWRDGEFDMEKVAEWRMDPGMQKRWDEYEAFQEDMRRRGI